MTKGEVFWNNVKMIKEQRGLKGWADIAQECGCSLSRLETMMYRKSLPRLDLALAISKTLCVDVDLLLSEYKVFPYLTRRDLSEPEVELIKLVRVGNSVDQQYKRKMLVTLMNTYNEKLIKNRMLTPMEIMQIPSVAELYRMAQEDNLTLGEFAARLKEERARRKENQES